MQKWQSLETQEFQKPIVPDVPQMIRTKMFPSRNVIEISMQTVTLSVVQFFAILFNVSANKKKLSFLVGLQSDHKVVFVKLLLFCNRSDEIV